MHYEHSSRNQLIGISLVVLAFLAIAIMNALAKTAMHTSSLGNVLFMQNFWALLCILPFTITLLKKQTSSHLKKQISHHWKLYLVRTFSALLSYSSLYIALQYIPLANATLLSNSAPLFLPFLAWIWLKEKISLHLWLSLIIGFFGVVFIINPSSSNGSHPWMVLLALLASLFSAIALQSIRNLARSEPPVIITLYYFFIASVALVPFCSWRNFSLYEWSYFIIIGICLALSQICIAKAYQYANPSLLGPFNYSVVIFAGIIEWLVWSVHPTYLSLIGIVIIIAGGTLSLRKEKPSRPI